MTRAARNILLAATAWAAMCACCLAQSATAPAPTQQANRHTLWLLEGEPLQGQLVSIDDKSVVFSCGGQEKRLDLGEVRSIRLDPAPAGPAGSAVVILDDGNPLTARGVQLAGGKLALENGLLGHVSLDLPAVRTISLPGESQKALDPYSQFLQLKLPKITQDYLLAVDKKGQLVPYPGVLKAITGDKVQFELDHSDRAIDLASVRLIELAKVPHDSDAMAGQVVGADGSVVGFTQLHLAEGKAQLVRPGLLEGRLELAQVAEIRLKSDRLVYLSDREMGPVQQAGMFDVAFGCRPDRSTTGGPLRLAGVTYARGLGLHSRCQVTYALTGQYSRLVALAGIDDAAARTGQAVLSITGDGKMLLAPTTLSAAGKPLPIRLDVKAVNRLTILVDFTGDGLDVGAHVDLVDARLIK